MELNNLVKTKKKNQSWRGIGSGKGKTSSRGHKGQKSRSGVLLKVLRVVRCHFTEDYLKEVLNRWKK